MHVLDNSRQWGHGTTRPKRIATCSSRNIPVGTNWTYAKLEMTLVMRRHQHLHVDHVSLAVLALHIRRHGHRSHVQGRVVIPNVGRDAALCQRPAAIETVGTILRQRVVCAARPAEVGFPIQILEGDEVARSGRFEIAVCRYATMIGDRNENRPHGSRRGQQCSSHE